MTPEDLAAEECGRREQRKRRTQRDLQEAALDLVAARGFEQVTIDDIAAAAEVSRTTVYRYFDSKEDVLLGKPAEKLERFRLALAEQPADAPPFVAVRDAVLMVAREYQHDRRQKLAVAAIMRDTPSVAARNLEHDAALEELLREHFARREPGGAGGLMPWIRAATVAATVRVAVDYWLARGADTDLVDVVDEAMSVLVDRQRGSAAPAAAAR